MKIKSESLCAICGDKATTKEHIPPRTLFIKPRPSDLITVPACKKCNNGTSKEDERFQVFLSLIIGDNNKKTRSFFESNALPTLNHANGFKKSILNKSTEVTLLNSSGTQCGKTGLVEIEKYCFDVVINKCIRGLYYNRYNEILDKDTLIKVSYNLRLTASMYEASCKLKSVDIGNGTFVFKYAIAIEEPQESIWFLQFYNKFWVVATTTKHKHT